jgi:hypothetical protein
MDARAVDTSHQTLVATAYPLQRNLAGRVDERVSQTMRLAGAARHYAKTLVVDVRTAGPLPSDTRPDLERASATLCGSVRAIVKSLSERRDGTYTRSASLFDGVERRLEQDVIVGGDELALRDLMMIDGALAEMAAGIGLEVTDHDTVQSARHWT